MRHTLKIYLSDLANTYYGVSPGTIPLASGYLASYLNKRFPGEVDVTIFRTLPPLLEAVQAAPPDIAGFSIYAWNPLLTIKAARLIKEMSPDTVTIAGGPAVELNQSLNAQYFERNPNMDFLVWHEGEIALSNIVESMLEHRNLAKLKQQAIDGSCFLSGGQLVAGKRLPLITPLEEKAPSPYLTGIFDDLLLDSELMPIVQTTRGCPYSCAFCVSGQADYNQLRSFDLARVKEEILYLKKHAANRSIRFTDDNFGLLPRDIELAQFVRDSFDSDLYPAGLKIYYGKLISERIKECALILRPLLPLCMSFQSLTPEVLEEIKRPNNSREKFEEARRWARQNDVTVATELIFGLPKETYDSYLQTLDGVCDLKVDSIFSTGLMLLEGADLNTKESREKYGFKTKHAIGADGITQFDGIVNVEGEEFVVETKWMKEDEFHKLNQLRLFATWFIGYGFFKEVLYHCMTFDIKLSQLFGEIMENPSKYPVFHGLLDGFDRDSRESLFDTREDLDQHVAARVQLGDKVEVTRLATVYVGMMISRKDEILDELKDLIIDLNRRLNGHGKTEFEAITTILCDLSKDFLVPMGADIPEIIEWRSSYDLVRWIRDDYERPIPQYTATEPLEFNLVMNNIAQTRMTNSVTSTINDEKLKMQYYLRHTNSSNIRRRIVYASETAFPVERHLLNLEGFADSARSVSSEDFPH